MSKHTPGPWRALITRAGDRCDGIVAESAYNAEDGYWESYIVQTDNGFYGPEVPDAHLIAAAPEMLDALTEASKFIGSASIACDWNEPQLKVVSALVDKCMAAIRKATGETR